jgi:hypothetical protein
MVARFLVLLKGHRLAASDPEVLPPVVEKLGSEPPDSTGFEREVKTGSNWFRLRMDRLWPLWSGRAEKGLSAGSADFDEKVGTTYSRNVTTLDPPISTVYCVILESWECSARRKWEFVGGNPVVGTSSCSAREGFFRPAGRCLRKSS